MAKMEDALNSKFSSSSNTLCGFKSHFGYFVIKILYYNSLFIIKIFNQYFNLKLVILFIFITLNVKYINI